MLKKLFAFGVCALYAWTINTQATIAVDPTIIPPKSVRIEETATGWKATVVHEIESKSEKLEVLLPPAQEAAPSSLIVQPVDRWNITIEPIESLSSTPDWSALAIKGIPVRVIEGKQVIVGKVTLKDDKVFIVREDIADGTRLYNIDLKKVTAVDFLNLGSKSGRKVVLKRLPGTSGAIVAQVSYGFAISKPEFSYRLFVTDSVPTPPGWMSLFEPFRCLWLTDSKTIPLEGSVRIKNETGVDWQTELPIEIRFGDTSVYPIHAEVPAGTVSMFPMFIKPVEAQWNWEITEVGPTPVPSLGPSKPQQHTGLPPGKCQVQFQGFPDTFPCDVDFKAGLSFKLSAPSRFGFQVKSNARAKNGQYLAGLQGPWLYTYTYTNLDLRFSAKISHYLPVQFLSQADNKKHKLSLIRREASGYTFDLFDTSGIFRQEDLVSSPLMAIFRSLPVGDLPAVSLHSLKLKELEALRTDSISTDAKNEFVYWKEQFARREQLYQDRSKVQKFVRDIEDRKLLDVNFRLTDADIGILDEASRLDGEINSVLRTIQLPNIETQKGGKFSAPNFDLTGDE